MIKPTPNPPKTDPASPFENPDSEKRHEDPDRIPSHADIRATPRTPSTMYILDPHINTEDLLGHACVSLASAHVMTMDLADLTHGPSLNTLLGIAQIIMLAELDVNGALDRLDGPK